MASFDTTDSLLFGRDLSLSTRLSALAGVLFAVSLFFHLPVRYLGGLSLTGPGMLAALFGTMFLVAAGCAYLNDGLVVSVAMASGLGIGFYAPAVVFNLGSLGEATLWVLVVGTASSVATGVVGFLAGAGGRRLVGE